MEALNESLRRRDERLAAARKLAQEIYASDDIDVLPGRWIVESSPEPDIEEVDGGYWVQARVWVDADLVEARPTVVMSRDDLTFDGFCIRCGEIPPAHLGICEFSLMRSGSVHVAPD